MTPQSASPASQPAGLAGTIPAVPVTGAQYELTAGDYRAVITELGAGLRELTRAGAPVVLGYPADDLPPAADGQLMLPWPNRVDGGRYRFRGAGYQLDLSEIGNGNAIHGLTRFAAWVPARHDRDSVTLRHAPHGYAGYPFCLEIVAGYRLDAATGLDVTISAANRGTQAAPYGFGQHPYLTVGTATLDEWELTLPATQWLPVDRRGIPSGPVRDIEGTAADFRQPRAIGATRLDHPVTGLVRDGDGDGRAWARLRSGGTEVSLWAGPGCPWLQVFTSDSLGGERHRKAIAIEPMTCPPNAFVSGDGLIVLEPGQTVTHSWGIQAGPA